MLAYSVYFIPVMISLHRFFLTIAFIACSQTAISIAAHSPRRIQSPLATSAPRQRIPGSTVAQSVVPYGLVTNGIIAPTSLLPTPVAYPGTRLAFGGQLGHTALLSKAAPASNPMMSLPQMGNGSGAMSSPAGSSPGLSKSTGSGGSGIYQPTQSAAPSQPSRRIRGSNSGETDLASLPPPRLENLSPATKGAFQSLRELANRYPACANTRVANRGQVGKVPGFFYGVANSFARSICRPPSDPVRAAMGGSKSKLVWNYARLYSLGMYESSGGKDIGMDIQNASSNRSHTAEAGIFQTSYNVRGGLNPQVRAALEGMENEYRKNPNACMGRSFAEGLGSYRDGGVIGGGSGAQFQVLYKRCPALASESAAITTINNPNHYGPVKRREAQPLPRCEELLKAVAEFVETNQDSVCPALAINPVPAGDPNQTRFAEARQ